MSGSLAAEDNVEPNMTPILDMVFQLITFFMLVINFKGAALDQSLQLPILGSAKPIESAEGESLLVLNVDPDGKLKVDGMEQKDPTAYIQQEARVCLKTAQAENPKLTANDELPTIVVVRADVNTHVDAVNTIVTLCQKQRFKRFSFRALSRKGDN